MTIKKTVMYLTSVDTVNYSQVPDTARDLCTVCVYNDTDSSDSRGTIPRDALTTGEFWTAESISVEDKQSEGVDESTVSSGV